MSEYGYTKQKSTVSRPSDYVREKKEARKKLIAEIEQRRRENYLRFIQKKRQLQPSDDLL